MKNKTGEELYAATREKNFDLLFLDIEMPGMDGFELAAKLCMNQPQVGLVFVSAHESFVFDAMEYSPLWFVRKGYLERDMFRGLRKYLQMTSFKGVAQKPGADACVQGCRTGGTAWIRNEPYTEGI